MKRTLSILFTVLSFVAITLSIPSQAWAQEDAPDTIQPDLNLSTTYPSQVVELGEAITLKLKLHAVGEADTVQLEMKEMPTGWNTTFRGGGRIIHSVSAVGRINLHSLAILGEQKHGKNIVCNSRW